MTLSVSPRSARLLRLMTATALATGTLATLVPAAQAQVVIGGPSEKPAIEVYPVGPSTFGEDGWPFNVKRSKKSWVSTDTLKQDPSTLPSRQVSPQLVQAARLEQSGLTPADAKAAAAGLSGAKLQAPQIGGDKPNEARDPESASTAVTTSQLLAAAPAGTDDNTLTVPDVPAAAADATAGDHVLSAPSDSSAVAAPADTKPSRASMRPLFSGKKAKADNGRMQVAENDVRINDGTKNLMVSDSDADSSTVSVPDAPVVATADAGEHVLRAPASGDLAPAPKAMPATPVQKEATAPVPTGPVASLTQLNKAPPRLLGGISEDSKGTPRRLVAAAEPQTLPTPVEESVLQDPVLETPVLEAPAERAVEKPVETTVAAEPESVPAPQPLPAPTPERHPDAVAVLPSKAEEKAVATLPEPMDDAPPEPDAPQPHDAAAEPVAAPEKPSQRGFWSRLLGKDEEAAQPAVTTETVTQPESAPAPAAIATPEAAPAPKVIEVAARNRLPDGYIPSAPLLSERPAPAPIPVSVPAAAVPGPMEPEPDVTPEPIPSAPAPVAEPVKPAPVAVAPVVTPKPLPIKKPKAEKAAPNKLPEGYVPSAPLPSERAAPVAPAPIAAPVATAPVPVSAPVVVAPSATASTPSIPPMTEPLVEEQRPAVAPVSKFDDPDPIPEQKSAPIVVAPIAVMPAPAVEPVVPEPVVAPVKDEPGFFGRLFGSSESKPKAAPAAAVASQPNPTTMLPPGYDVEQTVVAPMAPLPAAVPVVMVEPAMAPTPAPEEVVPPASPAYVPAAAARVAVVSQAAPVPPVADVPTFRVEAPPPSVPGRLSTPRLVPLAPTVSAMSAAPAAPAPSAGATYNNLPMAQVNFLPASQVVDSVGQAQLRAVADAMNMDAKATLMLNAYANASNASESRRISMNRALAVRSKLAEYGIQPARIEVNALGNDTPSDIDGSDDRVDAIIH